MSTKIKELRLPIVITANGTKAVAGMRQFQTVGKRLDDTLGKFASRQLSSVGGMLMGYLGIDAALSGLRQLYDYANKIQGLSRSYSPVVAAAYGQTKVAEQQQKKRMGQQGAPIGVEREKLAAYVATSLDTTGSVSLAQSAALLAEQTAALGKFQMAGFANHMAGTSGAEQSARAIGMGAEIVGLTDPTSTMSKVADFAAANADRNTGSSFASDTLFVLRMIADLLRGQR